jgi:RNA polymerase sigma factor (sigma-70 family)
LDRERRFHALFEQHESRLRAFLRRRCRPGSGVEPDDVLQELRIKLWNLLERERELSNPASYLMRAAVSTLIDAQRRATARQPESGFSGHDPENLPAASTPEDQAGLQQDYQRLEGAFQQMSADRARVVRLYLQGFGTREMARLTCWTEPRCRNLLYRGLEDLKALMKTE